LRQLCVKAMSEHAEISSRRESSEIEKHETLDRDNKSISPIPARVKKQCACMFVCVCVCVCACGHFESFCTSVGVGRIERGGIVSK